MIGAPRLGGRGAGRQGGMLGELGRWDEAMAVLDEVIQRCADPADPESRGWLAGALVSKGAMAAMTMQPAKMSVAA